MLARAYSLLEIKSVDAERRIITGIATSPSPDRMGDVVEPLGVSFRNPLPLLLHHDAKLPVGTVTFSKPTKSGIEFEARLPLVDEPPSLKDRIDTAWGSVKAGLIRGVSIGFRSLEHAFIKETDGIRFLKTEVLELSLVTVPANAACTIATLKSFDVDPPAAPGTGRSVVVRSLPGASGSRTGSQMKTIQEQISGWEATLAAESARMTGLLDKSAETGELLDDQQTADYEESKVKVTKITEHIARLRESETLNKAAAVPVNGSDPKKASESRGGVISVKSNLPTGTGFTRYAMALAAGRGSRLEAAEYAKRWEKDTPEVAMVLKAAMDAGTTTDATWAAPLVVYQNLANEFIELLRPATIIGRIPGLRRVPFNVSMPSQTAGATANWVGQGAPKPVSELAFTTLSLGMAKAAGIVVLSEELVRSSSPSAEAVVRQDLIATIGAFLDRQFIDPAVAAVTNVSPASITNGATVVDSTGVTAATFRADVKTAFATFTGANVSLAGAVWIMSETQALSFAMIQNALGQPEYPNVTPNGGTLLGLPIIASQHVTAEGGSPAGSRIILVKPSEILVADDGGVTLDVSREASIQMDSAPTNPPTASTVMVSLWQSNLVGLRAERYINWVRRRAEAVVVIEGLVYTG